MTEELDPGFPAVFDLVMDTTILVDSDISHNLATCRSITGLLGYMGRTPVTWTSKRQGGPCPTRLFDDNFSIILYLFNHCSYLLKEAHVHLNNILDESINTIGL